MNTMQEVAQYVKSLSDVCFVSIQVNDDRADYNLEIEIGDDEIAAVWATNTELRPDQAEKVLEEMAVALHNAGVQVFTDLIEWGEVCDNGLREEYAEFLANKEGSK